MLSRVSPVPEKERFFARLKVSGKCLFFPSSSPSHISLAASFRKCDGDTAACWHIIWGGADQPHTLHYIMRYEERKEGGAEGERAARSSKTHLSKMRCALARSGCFKFADLATLTVEESKSSPSPLLEGNCYLGDVSVPRSLSSPLSLPETTLVDGPYTPLPSFLPLWRRRRRRYRLIF